MRARLDGACKARAVPPSTMICAPFTNAPASLASSRHTPTMSLGSPMRPIGFAFATCATVSSVHAFEMSVANGPGSTVLARTVGFHAPARPIVSALSAALAIA